MTTPGDSLTYTLGGADAGVLRHPREHRPTDDQAQPWTSKRKTSYEVEVTATDNVGCQLP